VKDRGALDGWTVSTHLLLPLLTTVGVFSDEIVISDQDLPDFSRYRSIKVMKCRDFIAMIKRKDG
jgi:hypothetical protein